ncbi:MAG: phage minor head protein [Gemmataceae bacterium]
MTPDTIAYRTLPAALRAVRAARRRVLALARRHPGADPWALVDRIRAELAKIEPQLARLLTSATLAGWVLAARRPVKDAIPKPLAAVEPPPPVPPFAVPPGADEGGRPVEFPLVRAAVRDLMAREVVTRAEYDALGAQAKAAAFTVARVATADAVEAVRDAVAETVAQGKTLRQFRGDIADAIEGSGLADHHVETVFRTSVAQAQAAGLQAALKVEAVRQETPYLLYSATHDARTRPDHLAMERLGLDGTAVYRVSDPVVMKRMPPWSWNCFLPGTLIEGRVNVGLKSRYSGAAVEIVTREGHRLSVTANHPVLTPHGFARADSLREGDRLLSYRRGVERESAVPPASRPLVGAGDANASKQHGPTPVEQVFEALANGRPVLCFPTAPDDLHGEAKFGDGQVEVVGADWMLRGDGQPRLDQGSVDGRLAVVDVPHPDSTGDGFPPLGSVAPSLATAGSGVPLNNGGPPLGFGLADLLPLQTLHFGQGADLDAGLYQPTPHGGVAHAPLFSQVEQRLPALVSPDQIGDIPDIAASGGAGLELDAFGRVAKADASPLKGGPQPGLADASLAAELRGRFPAQVLLDQVVQVRQFQYRGHVYDLQSPLGYVIAESIVVSNCRCTVIPIDVETAAAKGVREARRWLATGIEPTPPARVPEPPFGPPPGWPDSSGIRAVIG